MENNSGSVTNIRGKVKLQKGNKLKSLFEIKRPKKSRGLQRTNSLPSGSVIGSRRSDSTSTLIRHESDPQKCHTNARSDVYGSLVNMDDQSLFREILDHKPEYVTGDLEENGTEFEYCCVPPNNTDLEQLSNVVDRSYRLMAAHEVDDVSAASNFDKNNDSTSCSRSINMERSYYAHNDFELPFMSKSFVHSHFPTDDETSPQISEKSLTLSRYTNNESIHSQDEDEDGDETTKKPRFVKNSETLRSRRRLARRRTGILATTKSVKELTDVFEGFQEADQKGETENYRRSLLKEMDKGSAEMLEDGFDDDIYLSMTNLAINDDDGDGEVMLNKTMYKNEIKDNVRPSMIKKQTEVEGDDDLFGTRYMEDGQSFVEAYNNDNEELVVSYVQFQREIVDLNEYHELARASSLGKVGAQILLTGDWTSKLSINTDTDDSSSKRNTIYSTTSGDSFEEDINFDEVLNPGRRETISDNNGIIRIERVQYYNKEPENELHPINGHENHYEDIEDHSEIGQSEPIILSELKIKKTPIEYILEEILLSERKYVQGLHKVIKDYKTFLVQNHFQMFKTIFGNIEDIYKNQQKFLYALEKCRLNLNEIIQCFIDFEGVFQLYPKYFKNTPVANATIKCLDKSIQDQQEKLGNRLGISAYLLTPIQRLGKYQLLLENLIKQLKDDNQSKSKVMIALDIVKRYMRKGNDAVAIASILQCPIRKTEEAGPFLMRESFTLLKPKRMEVTVFLFKNVIIFSTEVQNNSEEYLYYKHILTNDLRIATLTDNNIHLTDFEKEKRHPKSKHTFVLAARNDKIKDTWKSEIEKILWKQLHTVKVDTLKSFMDKSKADTLKSNMARTKVVDSKPTLREKDKHKRRTKSIGNSIFYER